MSTPSTQAPPSGAAVAAFVRRIPLIVATAFFMEVLDGSIITTALPAIAQTFHRPTLALSFGITIYLVTLAAFVPTAGWVSDRFGARNVFASAVGLFTIASLLCGLSQAPWLFFLARASQGLAAAFMSPVGRLVVLRETPKHYIIEAFSLLTWPALIAPVIGPPLAGFLTTYLTWRWIFYINIPVGLLGVWLILRLVPTYPSAPRVRFDSFGFVLTAAALALLVQGLSAMEASTQSRQGTVMLVAGALLALWSVRHALRTPRPMLDLRGVSVPSFAISNVTAGLLTRTAINATPFLLPLMFQIGFGMGPLQAGVMLLAYMLGNLVMKSATTAMLRRFGFYRVLTVNGTVCAIAIGACGLLTPATARLVIYAVLFVAGMTRSMNFTTVNTLAFADIVPEQRAGASTLAAMLQQLSSTLAVAASAWALSVSQHWRGAGALGLIDFRNGLLAAAVLMGLGTLWTTRLPRDVGAEIAQKPRG